MSGNNNTLEQERAAFLAHFRRDPAGLVYSRSPGGEGRLVSEDEAVALLVEFERMSHRHARRFSRSVWASAGGFLLFGVLGSSIAPLFFLLALPSLVAWFVVAVVQRLVRARFVGSLWARLGRNPPVRALTRGEKLARGFAIPWWQTALIFLVVAPFYFFVQAPTAALPPRWRDWQMIAIALVFVLGTAMLIWGGIRQWRRRTGAGPAGRR